MRSQVAFNEDDAHPLSPTAEPWKTVTEAELRHWRGDFGGIRIPELAPHGDEDPVTGIRVVGSNGRIARGIMQGAVFSSHLLNYTDAQQDLILAANVARGYTHLVVNISDAPGQRGYSAIYPPAPSTPENVNAMLKKVWRFGLIPVCVGIGVNDEEGYPAAKALADSIEPGLVRIVVPGIEANQDFSGDRRDLLHARFLNVRRAFPDALMYAWFTPWHSAGDVPEPDWWHRGWKNGDLYEEKVYEGGKEVGTTQARHYYDWPGGSRVFDGMVLQTDSFNDPVTALRHVEDQLIRLGGQRWKGFGGYWGAGVETDLILGETLVLRQFWDGMEEAEAVAYNDAILATTYRQVFPGTSDRPFRGQLSGFMNGGTTR